MINIAVLSSTRATDMEVVVDAIKKGMNAKIVCVVSNNKDAYALERARNHSIEVVFIDAKNKTREQYDTEMLRELEKRNVELVLLMGYMKIITPLLVERYRNRIMNIHPSLLPAFGGGMDYDVHQAVLDKGVKITGCTLHFVTEQIDEGPIIMQKAVEVSNDDTAETLKEKVQKAEQEIIVKAIKLFSEGRIEVNGNKVIIT